MLNFIKSVLIFLVFALFALVMHQYVSNSLLGECATEHFLNSTSELPLHKQDVEKSTAHVLKIIKISNSNVTTIFSFPESFCVNSSNSEVDIPNSLIGFKDSIYTYLNKNQQQELLITGKYLPHEINSINGQNFGVLRAKFIKEILVKFGVKTDRITTLSKENNYSYDANNIYNNGISLVFNTISNEKLDIIEKGIANKILYSNFSSKNFIPDKNLQAYVFEIKNYLEKYPNKKVLLEGHTDNIGTRDFNYWFGLQRAETIRKYLVNRGVPKLKIKVSSKGETLPVETNDTKQGRAKNRRIEITII